MFQIPAWAIGVVAILGGVGLMALLIELADGGELTPQPEVLEDLPRRVAELEERLDFAERLLAQRPDPEKRIPPR